MGQATIRDGLIHLPSGTFGPVSTLMQAELSLARSGGLDGAMVATRQFYETDYTKPVLFLSGGSYFEDRASAQNLLGDQWGMMNETGQYPGQAWLWLYTFWYQISPFKNSGNADAEIWVIMVLLTLALVVALPFVVWPLVRHSPPPLAGGGAPKGWRGAEPSPHQAELEEIESDLAAGRLSEGEAALRRRELR